MRSMRTEILLIGILAFTQNAKAQVFFPVGDMTVARAGHTATLLPDGTVLIAGGNAGSRPTAELYDPATGKFERVGDLITSRFSLNAVLLPNGNVLIADGVSAELYDPATRQFSLTGPLLEPQNWVVTVLLSNGDVLVAGDISAEIYDPSTGTFLPAGPYAAPSRPPTATLLRDGRVLFVSDDPTQLYDPLTNTFSVTGSLPFAGLELETATLLTNGEVLIAGGANDEVAPAGRVAAAELYDPATGTFRETSSMRSPRDAHAAVRLADGRVMVVGGDTGVYGPDGAGVFGGSLATAEIYDPSTGTFSPAGTMSTPRTGPQATLLKNGDVLITGGVVYCGIGCFKGSVASAEIYRGPQPRRRAVRR